MGSFIVVLHADILESCVGALRSIDHRGKPIIVCVVGKEFVLAIIHHLFIVSRLGLGSLSMNTWSCRVR